MITIKDNEKPEIEVCKMKCDKGLAKHLNKFEMLSHLNKSQSTLLLGRPASGKTSLLYALFKGSKDNRMLNRVYSTIYLFQPMTSRGSMANNIFEELPDDQKSAELTYENLAEVYDRVEKDAEDGYTSCVVMDDMGSYLKNKDIFRLFKVMFSNRRHLKLSLFFAAQTFFSFPKECRRLFSNLIVFKVSKDEFSNISKELLELKPDIIEELLPMIYDEPYKYLFVNLDSQKLYKNFDSIVINR